MEVVRSGAQYWKNPRFRDTELNQVCPIPPRSTAESRHLIGHHPSAVFENWVFRQSRWAVI